jgi:hypothetical protein
MLRVASYRQVRCKAVCGDFVASLCIQLQLKRSPTLHSEHIEALCRGLATEVGASMDVTHGRGGGRYVNYLFDADDVPALWEMLCRRLFLNDEMGAAIRNATIVTRTGDRGWDDYRLLHHYES